MKTLRKTLLLILTTIMFLLPVLTACGEDAPPEPQEAVAKSLKLTEMQTNFSYGEPFTSEGLVVKVIYSDKTEKTSEDFTVDSSNYNATTAGTYEIKVNCEGLTRSYSVIVAEQLKPDVAVTELKLSGMKQSFAYAESFSSGGLVVTAVYEDGTEGVMSQDGYVVVDSEYDKNVSGEYDILVVHKRIVASYKVTVAAAPATGIRLEGMKMKFELNEQFSAEGLAVRLVYADYSTSPDPIESGYIVDSTGFRMGEEGKYEIIVHYGDFTGYYFATVGNPQLSNWEEDGVLKILLLGHSFTEDSAEYLWEVCNSMGLTAEIALLWVGGSTIEQRHRWAVNDTNNWELKYKDAAQRGVWRITRGQRHDSTIASNNWDFILIPPETANAHIPNEFLPTVDGYLAYLKTVIDDDTKLCWLSQWSDMEGGVIHENIYTSSSLRMYEMITGATQNHIVPRGLIVVPAGTAVQNARTSDICDTTQFTRDGHHLSFKTGRYIAAVTTFASLTNMSIDTLAYAPEGVSKYEREVIIQSVSDAIKNPFSITQSPYPKV